jgi:hypothetical protein
MGWPSVITDRKAERSMKRAKVRVRVKRWVDRKGNSELSFAFLFFF